MSYGITIHSSSGNSGLPCPIGWSDGTVTAKITRPGNGKVTNNGWSSKSYRPNKRLKRVVRAKCYAMSFDAFKRKRSLFFIALTSLDHIETNEPVSRFIENMKKRGFISDYVWVRERQKRGANHWHILFTSEMQWMNWNVLRRAWSTAMSNCGFDQGNRQSLRTGTRPKVYKADQAVKYITKYLNKPGEGLCVLKKGVPHFVDENIRLTHSSRIQYKGPIELTSFVNWRNQPKMAARNEYVISYFFDPNVEYINNLRACWDEYAYLTNIYRNESFNSCGKRK